MINVHRTESNQFRRSIELMPETKLAEERATANVSVLVYVCELIASLFASVCDRRSVVYASGGCLARACNI